jgi:16S rRNA (guanine966-N2)-methyltransferase
MRIIGGKWKGRRFSPPKGFKGRPTTDFGRESLFNVLQHRVELDGARICDLFAGSGMVSLEFSSRGAASVTAVDQNPGAAKHIYKLFEDLEVPNGLIVRADVFAFLKRQNASYDIIFADPPYSHPHLLDLPEAVMDSGILEKNGLFILEHGDRIDLSQKRGFLEHRRYGQVHFSFFGT